MPEEDTTREETSEAGRKGAPKRWTEGGGEAAPKEREALSDIGQKGGESRGRKRDSEMSQGQNY